MSKIYLSAFLLSLCLWSNGQSCDTTAINTYLGNAGFRRVYVPEMPCSRYYYYPTAQYGIDAHRTAANLGIPQLIINDAFEDSVVSAALYAQGVYFIQPQVWLGMTDSNSIYTWRTFDGSPLPAYTNWTPGEPNDLQPNCQLGSSCIACFGADAYWCAHGEDCAVLNASGKWLDIACEGGGRLNVTVLEVNTCPAIAKPIDTTICAGNSVHVNATVASGGTAPLTYTWNPGALTGSTQTLSPGATTTLTVQVADRFSCIADTTVTITINPNAPVANAGPDVQLCPGATDTLGVAAVAGYTYSWTSGWGLSSTSVANPAFHIASNPRSAAIDTTFILTASAAGCSANDTVKVTLYPDINNNFTVPASACGTNDVTVVYSGTSSGTATYGWSFDSATIISGSGAGAYVLSWPTSGVKTITLNVTDNGCTATPVSKTVTIHPASTPVITAAIHALQTTTYPSYQWLENGSPISGATGRTILATSNGNYQVVVVDSNGCVDTSAIYKVTGVGISEISGQNMIRIYPNPNAGTFTIETTDAIGAEMTITDLLGRIVMRETITSNKQPVKLNVSPGEYYVNIRLNDGSYTGHLVISKE